MSKSKNEAGAFEVTVVGREWSRVVNARTRGAAKSEYARDLRESWPDIPFTALRARRVGGVRSSEQFKACARYRGLAGMRCGDRVKVGEATGVVVGHNESANFLVLFDGDSPRYADRTLPVHPDGMELELPQKNTENTVPIRLVVKRPVGETPTGATETVALPGKQELSSNRIGMENTRD